jgi:hypothetical protein
MSSSPKRERVNLFAHFVHRSSFTGPTRFIFRGVGLFSNRASIPACEHRVFVPVCGWQHCNARRLREGTEKARFAHLQAYATFAIVIVQALSLFFTALRKKHKAAAGLQNQSMTRENGGLTPWEV